MPPIRPKPPIETKAQLMQEIAHLMRYRYPEPESAVLYLLNFFTSVDLVGIRDELRKEAK